MANEIYALHSRCPELNPQHGPTKTRPILGVVRFVASAHAEHSSTLYPRLIGGRAFDHSKRHVRCGFGLRNWSGKLQLRLGLYGQLKRVERVAWHAR